MKEKLAVATEESILLAKKVDNYEEFKMEGVTPDAGIVEDIPFAGDMSSIFIKPGEDMTNVA
jgi:hypothetical protein